MVVRMVMHRARHGDPRRGPRRRRQITSEGPRGSEGRGGRGGRGGQPCRRHSLRHLTPRSLARYYRLPLPPLRRGVVDSHGVCPQVIHNLRFTPRSSLTRMQLTSLSSCRPEPPLRSSACFPMRDEGGRRRYNVASFCDSLSALLLSLCLSPSLDRQTAATLQGVADGCGGLAQPASAASSDGPSQREMPLSSDLSHRLTAFRFPCCFVYHTYRSPQRERRSDDSIKCRHTTRSFILPYQLPVSPSPPSLPPSTASTALLHYRPLHHLPPSLFAVTHSQS